MAVSGVGSAGFQTTGSPQTAAIAAFHDHTATGKLNAVMTPTGPERMPLLHHAVAGPLGRDGQAVELAREADREVADVDHLLHFAVAFGADLAHLERDEFAERLLELAQRVAEIAHDLAALGRRALAPGLERPRGRADHGVGRRARRLATAAIGSPVVGLTDTSRAASASPIHSFGPEHAPALTSST